MPGLVTVSGFTLSTDRNSVPVAAYDSLNNLLGVEKWVLNPTTGLFQLEAADPKGYPIVNTGGITPSAAVVLQNAATANGNGADLPMVNYSQAVLDIQITGTATVQFWAQGPGGNWYQIYGLNLTTNTSVNQITASALINISNCHGVTAIEARITGVSGGVSITVTGVGCA